MRAKLIMIAAAAAALAFPLAATAASAATIATADGNSIVGDPGVYLSSTHTLTLAAPNNVVTGKAAVLKTCLGNGDCATFANLKGTETFDYVANIKIYTPPAGQTLPGYEIRLHGTNWCVTNRGTAVTFEQCADFASQVWYDSHGAPAPQPGEADFNLTNQKTGLRLTHGLVQAYSPVQVSSQHTSWSSSS